jgi:small subunit ribosomal protein S8
MDLLSNLIANIKNGYQTNINIVRVTKSKRCLAVLGLLYEEGYISGFKKDPENKYKILVFLKYFSSNIPAISNIQGISTQGYRIYTRISLLWQIKKLNQQKITYVLSTPFGIMTDHEALKKKIGGELLFKIF